LFATTPLAKAAAPTRVMTKWLCQETGQLATQAGGAGNISRKVVMTPVTADEGEDSVFGKWTPQGRLNLEMLNPGAATCFEAGKKYYLCFIPLDGADTSLPADTELVSRWRVGGRQTSEYGQETSWTVTLQAVPDRVHGSIFEGDYQHGHVQMTLRSPYAGEVFVPRREFLVAFCPQPEPTAL
jgi:hypothetical protein